MKTITILYLITLVLHLSASAQTTSTWLGGTPGLPTDWNYPGNWREGRVPDEFDQVIIPSERLYYPVIKAAASEIDALFVMSGACLTIKRGAQLTILGVTGRMDGLTVQGKIFNEGELFIKTENEVAMLNLKNVKFHQVKFQ